MIYYCKGIERNEEKKRELDSYAVNLRSPSKKKSNSSYIAPSAVAYYIVQGCDVGYIAVSPNKNCLYSRGRRKKMEGEVDKSTIS